MNRDIEPANSVSNFHLLYTLFPLEPDTNPATENAVKCKYFCYKGRPNIPYSEVKGVVKDFSLTWDLFFRKHAKYKNPRQTKTKGWRMTEKNRCHKLFCT